MCASTFSNERRNKILKLTFHRVRNKPNNSRWGLSRWMNAFLAHYKRWDFQPVRALGWKREYRALDHLLAANHVAPSVSELCLRVAWPGGVLAAGEIVRLRGQGIFAQVSFFIVGTWSMPSFKVAAFAFGHEYEIADASSGVLRPARSSEPLYFAVSDPKEVVRLVVYKVKDCFKLASSSF